jgi:hypothetical protein
LSGRLRNPEFVGWLLLAGAIGVAAALVLWLQRGLTFGWDELVWLEIGGPSPIELLWRPYGGHLIVVPYLLFRGVMEVFGASFTVFAVIQVLLLSLAATLLYVYGKRRIGPLLALVPAIVLLFLGGAYPVLLEPMIGIQFLAAIVPGLAAILLLEREDLLGDACACALLCLALAGFSQALPFLVGAVVSIALSPNWKRRLWVVAVPILAYGYWRLWAAQFEPSGLMKSNIPLLPVYLVDALAVFATAAFGMFKLIAPGPWSIMHLQGFSLGYFSIGIVFAMFELLAAAAAVALLRRRGPIPRTLWPAVAMLLVLVVELGVILQPGRTAAEPRYLYAGVLLLLLVAIELCRGVKTARVTLAVAFALTVAALAGGAARFQEARTFLLDYSTHARADMSVIELAGQKGDQVFTPNLALPKVISGGLVLNSGPWLLMVERYDSSAYSIAELQSQVEEVREEADLVARRSLRLRLDAVAGPGGGRCRRIAEAASGDIALPRGGAVLIPAGGATVSGRRWADDFILKLGSLAAGSAARLRIPADASEVPWRVRLEPAGSLRVCRLTGPPPSAPG